MTCSDDILRRKSSMRPTCEPTPFDAKRAEEIWARRGPQLGQLSQYMTDGEISYVFAIWDKMAGNTSWMTAFFRIKNGEVISL